MPKNFEEIIDRLEKTESIVRDSSISLAQIRADLQEWQQELIKRAIRQKEE